jgi:hypothetical protein
MHVLQKTNFSKLSFLQNLKTGFFVTFKDLLKFILIIYAWKISKYCLYHYCDENSLRKNHLKNILKIQIFCKIRFFSKMLVEGLKIGIEACLKRLQLFTGLQNCFKNLTEWRFHQVVHKMACSTSNFKGWRYYPPAG